MAQRDVLNFRFLRDALIQKYHRPQDSLFHDIPYDPTIYRLAYNTFRQLHLNDYLNIKDPQVLEKFYLNLKRDGRLKFLDNPEAFAKDPLYELPEQYYQELPKEVAAQQQVLAAETAPVSTPPASIPHLGIPSVQTTPGTIPTPAISEKVEEEPSTMVSKAETPTIPKATPQIRMPGAFVNTVKNFTSASGRLFQRGIGRHLTLERAATGFTTVLGGIIGSSLGPVGTLAGAGAGFLTPSFIKSGGGRFFSGFGNGVINFGVGISNQASRLSVPNPSNKFVWVGIGLFFLFVLGAGLLAAVLPPAQPGEAAPITGPTAIVTDLTSCQFTRGDRSPPAESYKSPVLLGYFQQASQISSVPAVVLAAIARVESPTVTAKTDAELPQLSSIAGCPRSSTGALGIMQVQPPSTRGYIKDAIEKGASYLGKTAQDLTEADFCDLRSNIIIASGFILKKLQGAYGIGDGDKWDPSWTNNKEVIYKLAEGYYGCLEYGGPDPLKCGGPYNYGDDIWTSIQSCKTTQVVASCPVPGGQIRTPSYQKNPTTGHCSPSYGSCPAESRRAKSIDVDTQGQEVIFPTINGQKVEWVYLNEFSLDKPGDCEGGLSSCGKGYVFQAQSGSDNWILHLLHLDPRRLFFRLKGINESGFPVGTTVPGIFLHIDIGSNITNPSNPPQGDMDFDPGWIPPDFMCQ